MESEAKDTSSNIKRNFMEAIYSHGGYIGLVCKEMAMSKTRRQYK